MGARSAVATVAWLATDHQQLMYLLSPEGKTVFYIPGVEVVHKVSTPINLPEESNKIKMEPGKMQPPPGGSRKRAAGLSLDLNSASAKRNKQVQSLLTSPDVQMLKLTSPELEKFLIQNPTLATPTPSGYIFPKSVTEEQAMYAKGFEEALEHLRQSEPPGSNDLAAANTLATLSTASVGPAGRTLEVHRTLPESHRSLDVHKSLPEAQQNQGIPLSVQASSHSRPASGASGSYDSETYQVPDGVKIKDEPDDHLSLSGSDYGSEGMKSPPMNTTGMSPIDMETQEKIKLDRKRQRNRLAASKCRKRKLERISQLDDRVSALKNENADLAAVVKKMKAGVALLKQEVIEHVNSGCDIRVAEGANF